MYQEMKKMSDGSRVWIFQSSRPIESRECDTIMKQAVKFAEQWTAHSNDLMASVDVLHDHFVVVAVDESKADASGCSIDSMTRFIKDQGVKMDIDFFDRKSVVVEQQQKLSVVSIQEANEMAEADDSLIVYDNLVSDLHEFRTNWKKKVSESWLRNFV